MLAWTVVEELGEQVFDAAGAIEAAPFVVGAAVLFATARTDDDIAVAAEQMAITTRDTAGNPLVVAAWRRLAVLAGGLRAVADEAEAWLAAQDG
jgi:hypothetical protein